MSLTESPATSLDPCPRADLDASPAERYSAVRRASEWLAAPLSAEDATVQSMPDVSPAKWHLAHTTWFFETFVLEPWVTGYRHFHDAFRVLFNSYYNAVGEQFPRPRRGLISRPGLDEVKRYRAHVDAAMLELLAQANDDEMLRVVETGLNHEQQQRAQKQRGGKYGKHQAQSSSAAAKQRRWALQPHAVLAGPGPGW